MGHIANIFCVAAPKKAAEMKIEESVLFSNTWKFTRADGQLIAPVLRFLPSGLVGGYNHNFERCWSVEGNNLSFRTIYGHTTTLFDEYVYDEQGLQLMRGRSRIDASITHVLERIKMPSAVDFGQIASPDMPVFVTSEDVETKRRRNLVVLRANEQSLHKQWPIDINPADRNWDLCISWYGRELPEEIGFCEYFTHQANDRKFSAIYKLFLAGSPLFEYENVYLPDDDLMMTWSDINKLFNIFRISKVDLAQPSLVPTSYVTHPVTAQDTEYFLRYTSFVELMCPIFTREFLQVCLPTFEASVSGFGLDHIWSLMAGRAAGRIAVIDDIAVAHTRPPNKNYNVIDAIMEERSMSNLYNSSTSYQTFGGIQRPYTLG